MRFNEVSGKFLLTMSQNPLTTIPSWEEEEAETEDQTAAVAPFPVLLYLRYHAASQQLLLPQNSILIHSSSYKEKGRKCRKFHAKYQIIPFLS